MSIKGIKRIIVGEKMPDKDAPENKERYEREVEAGKKFAKWSRIDVLVSKVQHFAENNRKIFFSSIFIVLAFLGIVNVSRLVSVFRHRHATTSVIAVQDSLLQKNFETSGKASKAKNVEQEIKQFEQ